MNYTIPFRPKLEGAFRTRFHSAACKITSNSTIADIEEIVEREVRWVEEECVVNLSQRKKYRAVWLLFRDLIRASWKVNYINGSLEMSQPDVDDIQHNSASLTDKKSYIRSWMAESRLERISIGAEFIRKMEEQNSSGHSIIDLIADGSELAAKMQSVISGSISIDEAISPYLQLVTEGEVDNYSGFKISDIWRYFRYSWSTPYETTPGRTMQYLIRDASHPMHAVMGLASLENCALQITCRDQYIGWETSNFIEKIKAEDPKSTKKIFVFLQQLIKEGIDAIKYDEFCSKEEIDNPSESLISRLQEIAIESEEERKNNLKDYAQLSSDSIEQSISLTSVSSESLFKRKRSEQLAKLLSAKISINSLLNSKDFSSSYLQYVESPSGFTAIRTALLIQKNKHIGSSMLELNVCGAIPPYNEILGGKLVALLATSPQIFYDYKQRYSNQASEIASKLKGEKVYKPSDLVYIGTTSLYSVGSSQYNRLKIPKEAINSNYDIIWKEIGKTFGFGTLHISKETTSRLNEAVSQDGYSTINHVFGEGASPKMRLLRKAISELLETNEREANEFSRHAMSRIVYAAFLAQNTRDYLLGEDSSPILYFSKENAVEKTNCIIDYWKNRWVLSRLKYTPIFERLSSFDKNSFLISNELKSENIKISQDMTNPDDLAIDNINPSEMLSFIRNFYRGNSAFADNLEPKYLKDIHIATNLDTAIIKNLKKGNDIVLTGNPGDGKTHIIRMLLPQINALSIKPCVELDASTKTEEELYNEWKIARESNRPFVLAINAALLHSLADSKSDDYIQSAKSQMTYAIQYERTNVDIKGVVVFDLSRRDILYKDIIQNVLNKITNKKYFKGCEKCFLLKSCPVHKNINEIKDPLFQERLTIILRRASLTGYHATLRDIQSLASFLLFGGKQCKDFVNTAGNDGNNVSDLLYQGKGRIFEAIKKSFDPSLVSHPVLDEKILTSSFSKEGWSSTINPSQESLLPSNDTQFKLRKRQFFFFHKDGKSLLDISSDDVSIYHDYLAKDDSEKLKDIIDKLNKLFRSDEGYRSLRIWTSHRFNHSPRKMLISSGYIRRSKFEIQTPCLRKEMAEGIKYEPPFVRLCLKENKSISLRIDYDIYHMLLCNERGLPNLLLESEEVKRIWRFMDLLRSESEDDNEDEKEVIISDLQNNKKVTVLIDLEKSMYYSIK